MYRERTLNSSSPCSWLPASLPLCRTVSDSPSQRRLKCPRIMTSPWSTVTRTSLPQRSRLRRNLSSVFFCVSARFRSHTSITMPLSWRPSVARVATSVWPASPCSCSVVRVRGRGSVVPTPARLFTTSSRLESHDNPLVGPGAAARRRWHLFSADRWPACRVSRGTTPHRRCPECSAGCRRSENSPGSRRWSS